MNQDSAHKSVWFVYIASLLTPFTCLLSGVIGIIYAGYRLDKNQDGEIANSHYYGSFAVSSSISHSLWY